MTQVKICGLRVGDDVSFANRSVVSHVGILFVEASKRYVPAEEAASIIQLVPPTCQVMGVFADQETDLVLRTLQTSKATGVQLHGTESVALCDFFKSRGYEVWKSISVPASEGDDGTIDHVIQSAHPYLSSVDGILLDTAPPTNHGRGVTGGYGKRFDWSLLPSILSALKAEGRAKVWVAGGITPENVSDLLSQCDPDGIDVSSGVEVDGRKSISRIQDLLEAVERFG